MESIAISKGKCGENVGISILFFTKVVPTSLFHHVGGVCSYSKCVEMLV